MRKFDVRRESWHRKKVEDVLGFQVGEVVSLDGEEASLGVGASVASERLKETGTKGRLWTHGTLVYLHQAEVSDSTNRIGIVPV